MSRDPKGLKFMSIVEAAYNKAGLTEEEAQRVNDTPGLAEHVASFIAKSRQPNQFEGEEVRSSYDYPPEYKGPRLIAEQIAAIAKIFGLDPAQALECAKKLPQRPEGAEGYFAFPSVDALAEKYFPEVTDPAEKYCRAIQLIHQKIAELRTFYNWREGQTVPAQLRLTARTAEFLAKIVESQPGDILIIAAQLGKRHRGKSVRRAREVFVQNEFGLGSLIVGSIALTHPERFVRSAELDMDCAGDEFDPAADGSFDHAPCFVFAG
ncbi:MAG: hypothetical protein AAB817_02300, partial [Patescibacteria group bacterium]